MMKKSIFFICVCVVMLLAIPVVGAAENTTAIMVNGSVPGYLSIIISNPTVNFGTMSNATPSFGDGMVSISTNIVPWTITARDPLPTGYGPNKGYMVDSSNIFHMITIPFLISKNTGVYSDLRTDYTDFMTGYSSGTFNQPLFFKQTVPQDALVGNYSITVEFVGSAA